MRPETERLTEEIARATRPDKMSGSDALEIYIELRDWLSGSIEALEWEIEEFGDTNGN